MSKWGACFSFWGTISTKNKYIYTLRGTIWIIREVLKSLITLISNMNTGLWDDSLIVLWWNMVHLLGKALDGHYQGLKKTPGVTVPSPRAGIPLSPAVRSLVPPNEVLWWRGVSVSMASKTQTAWEIRVGTRPWFSVDPTYQQQINTLGHGNACMRTIWTRVGFNEAAK